MSITIYHGKRIQKTPLQAYRLLQSLRPVIQDKVNIMIQKGLQKQLLMIAGETAIALQQNQLPDLMLYLPPHKRNQQCLQQFMHDLTVHQDYAIISLFWNWAHYFEHEQGSHMGPVEFHIYFAMEIFLTAKATYCIPLYQNTDLLSCLNGLDWLEDYAYWNGAEEPEHISEEEWALRDKTWRKVLPKEDFEPAGARITFTSIDQSWLYGISLSQANFDRAAQDLRSSFIKHTLLDEETKKVLDARSNPKAEASEIIQIQRTLNDRLQHKDPELMTCYQEIDKIYPRHYADCHHIFTQMGKLLELQNEQVRSDADAL